MWISQFDLNEVMAWNGGKTSDAMFPLRVE